MNTNALQTRNAGTGTHQMRCGHSRSAIGRAFYFIASVVGLAALFLALVLVLAIIDGLLNAPQPETREFERFDGTSYERTQTVWEVGDE